MDLKESVPPVIDATKTDPLLADEDDVQVLDVPFDSNWSMSNSTATEDSTL